MGTREDEEGNASLPGSGSFAERVDDRLNEALLYKSIIYLSGIPDHHENLLSLWLQSVECAVMSYVAVFSAFSVAFCFVSFARCFEASPSS